MVNFVLNASEGHCQNFTTFQGLSNCANPFYPWNRSAQSKMPLLLRPSPRLLLRPIQRCAYSSAPAPAINVTNVPAPHSGSIRILSLNRPAARNAISRQLLTELHHQVNSIQSEGDAGPTRALILASEVDTSFCAGADLKERATFTQEEYVRSTRRQEGQY